MLNWKQYKHVCEAWKTYDKFGMELDAERMWADLKEQFGAYPDGAGNIWFDTPEGEMLFILKFAVHDNPNN